MVLVNLPGTPGTWLLASTKVSTSSNISMAGPFELVVDAFHHLQEIVAGGPTVSAKLLGHRDDLVACLSQGGARSSRRKTRRASRFCILMSPSLHVGDERQRCRCHARTGLWLPRAAQATTHQPPPSGSSRLISAFADRRPARVLRLVFEAASVKAGLGLDRRCAAPPCAPPYSRGLGSCGPLPRRVRHPTDTARFCRIS